MMGRDRRGPTWMLAWLAACLPPDAVRTDGLRPRIQRSALWFFLRDLEFVAAVP